MNSHEPLGRIRGILPTFSFLFRLSIDMFSGLVKFRHVPNTVTVYGSARLSEDNKYCQMAYDLGKALAKRDIEVMTGGGPGIMEAVNKGAASENKPTNGCHINLPFEQKQNEYLTLSHETEFFFVRKFLLRHSSKAVVAFPGGFGTLDELFECLTLIRTNCAPKIPTILIGKDYWQPLIDFIGKTMLEHGTISEIDVNQVYLTDDINEVCDIIAKAVNDK